MEIIHRLFGEGKDLNALQMSMRAFVFFFLTLLFIRISGRRVFGKKSPFDNIIVIVLGSVVARGIAGASSFGATVAASFVLVIIHRLLSWFMIKNKSIEKLVNGNDILLYQNGEIIPNNLMKAGMSKDDLYASLRLETKAETLEEVEKSYMETNGRISFILKKKS